VKTKQRGGIAAVATIVALTLTAGALAPAASASTATGVRSGDDAALAQAAGEVVKAEIDRALASAGVASPASAPDNNDRDYFHLLWRGRQDPLPGGGGAPSAGAVIKDLTTGLLKSQIIRDALNGLVPIPLPAGFPLQFAFGIGTIVSAFMFVYQLIDFFQSAEGGTKAMIERYSGQCAGMWETYAKVRLGGAFASRSIDLIWETASRDGSQYVREIFTKYLGRQPNCDELRGDINRMGNLPDTPGPTTWHSDGSYNELKFTVCDRTAPDGVPWSLKHTTDRVERLGIMRFCAAARREPDKLKAAYVTADKVTEWCPDTGLQHADVLRQRVKTSGLPYPSEGGLDDIFGAIGRPSSFDDMHDYRYKTGRMVLPRTAVNVYKRYFRRMPNGAGTPDQYGARLAEDSGVRDFACRHAGRFIQEQEYGAFGALAESDAVLRDFFDMNSRVPFGTDVLGTLISAYFGQAGSSASSINLWQFYATLAKPDSCHWEDPRTHTWRTTGNAEMVANGYNCKNWVGGADPGWEILKNLFAGG